MIYCPYSNSDIDEAAATREHIIPLSLGGNGSFCIQVDADFNSTFGHSIDAEMANDPLLVIQRTRQDVRGHSNKPPNVKWKTTDEQGRRLQTVIDPAGLSIFDCRERRHLTESETTGGAYTANFHMKRYPRLRFSAKVALGTGHFIFGDLFRSHTKHDFLRMLLTPLDKIPEADLRANQVLYFDRLNDPTNDRVNPRHLPIEMLLNAIGCSGVVILFGAQVMTFSIGLLGEWHSTIVTPITADVFPFDGDYDLGHVIALQNGGIIRTSFRAALDNFQKALNTEHSAPP